MSARAHRMRVRFGVPAVVLRGSTVIIGSAGAIVLNEHLLWQIVSVVALLLGAIWPQSLAAWVGAGGIVVGIAASEPSPWRTALALLIVHLVHVLGSVCMQIPALSRVHPRALLPTLRRFLLVEAIAQPLALLVVVVPAAAGDAIAWLAPVGALIAVGLVVLAVRARSRS